MARTEGIYLYLVTLDTQLAILIEPWQTMETIEHDFRPSRQFSMTTSKQTRSLAAQIFVVSIVLLLVVETYLYVARVRETMDLSRLSSVQDLQAYNGRPIVSMDTLTPHLRM